MRALNAEVAPERLPGADTVILADKSADLARLPGVAMVRVAARKVGCRRMEEWAHRQEDLARPVEWVHRQEDLAHPVEWVLHPVGWDHLQEEWDLPEVSALTDRDRMERCHQTRCRMADTRAHVCGSQFMD